MQVHETWECWELWQLDECTLMRGHGNDFRGGASRISPCNLWEAGEMWMFTSRASHAWQSWTKTWYTKIDVNVMLFGSMLAYAILAQALWSSWFEASNSLKSLATVSYETITLRNCGWLLFEASLLPSAQTGEKNALKQNTTMSHPEPSPPFPLIGLERAALRYNYLISLFHTILFIFLFCIFGMLSAAI